MKAAGLDEIPPEVWKTRKFDRWTKGCILPFPKKGDLRISKNCCGITLTSIAAKIYNALLLNHIAPTFEKILGKNKNSSQRNRSTISQVLTILEKILEATLLFEDFCNPFDSIQRRKMEQIFLAYGLPKETITAKMMLYKNTKVKVHPPDGDTDFLNIVTGVLQGNS